MCSLAEPRVKHAQGSKPGSPTGLLRDMLWLEPGWNNHCILSHTVPHTVSSHQSSPRCTASTFKTARRRSLPQLAWLAAMALWSLVLLSTGMPKAWPVQGALPPKPDSKPLVGPGGCAAGCRWGCGYHLKLLPCQWHLVFLKGAPSPPPRGAYWYDW